MWGKGKKGRKEWNSCKNERKYPYFVSLFIIGPLTAKKQGRMFLKIKGGGRFFWVAIIYTPDDMQVKAEKDGKIVDAKCHALTAPHVRYIFYTFCHFLVFS